MEPTAYCILFINFFFTYSNNTAIRGITFTSAFRAAFI